MASNDPRDESMPIRTWNQGSVSTQRRPDSNSAGASNPLSRLHLAESLIREYERGQEGSSRHLQDAIEHLQSGLRQVSLESPLRPLFLSELCYAHTSEYIRSGSQSDIDEAVHNGRLARLEALGHGLRDSASNALFDAYCRLMNNLGVALSTRAQNDLGREDENGSVNLSATAVRDLDEAIELAREHKSLLEGRGERSDAVALNLASRLSARGSKTGNYATDHPEALQLLRHVQQTAAAGSETHNSATLLVGRLEIERFRRTRNLETLDAALHSMKEAVTRIPESAEMFAPCHNLVKSAYLDRHIHTGDIEDLAKAVRFSARTLDTNPCPKTLKISYLVAHMTLLRQYALATTSISWLDKFEYQASKQLDSIPCPFPDEHKCRRLQSDVILKKYLLSKKLEDLSKATFSVYEALHDESGHTVLNGVRVRVQLGDYYNLMKIVARLLRAPPNLAKAVACEVIHTCLSRICEPPNLVVGLSELSHDVIKKLEVYERCARTGEVITEEVARERAEKSDQGQDEGRDLSESLSAIFGFDPTIPMPPKRLTTQLILAERIGVQRAKAEGKHPNPRLCLMCQSLKPLRPVRGKSSDDAQSDFEWNQDMKYLPLGNWEHLSTRRDCSICRLIRSLIVADPESESPVLHPRLQDMDEADIQGAGLYVGEREETGERVLVLEYNQKVVGHLRILPTKEPVSISAYLQAQLTPENTREDEPEIKSRKANRDVLRGWLETCELKHGKSCNLRSGSHRYDADTPLILIDVVDRCLVSRTSTPTRYFVLSYVRGTVSMLETRRNNYDSRCRHGGLPPELPATIEDAMSLVQSLGERYLWVDTLCVLQDHDREVKGQISATMDVILIQAYATIVALSSTNASGGILGVNTPWCRKAGREILTIDAESPELYWTPIPESSGRTIGPEKTTVELIGSPPQLDLVVATSEWDQRAWTFQERFLSPRCLYFSDQTVYFRCQSPYVLSHGGVNGLVKPISERWGTSNLEPLDNILLGNLQEQTSEMSSKTRVEKMFQVYKDGVEIYTGRKLSQDGEILDAFAGSLLLLNAPFSGSQHWCGLLPSALSHELLWTPVGKTFRRGLEVSLFPDTPHLTSTGRQAGSILPTNRGTIQFVYGPDEVTAMNDNVDRRFPSWSWAGWKGAVDYSLFKLNDEKAASTFPVSVVKEFALNLGGQGNLDITPDPGACDLPASEKYLPLPSIPNVLQFEASCLPLTTFTISPVREYLSSPASVFSAPYSQSPSQGVRAILDRHGNRCGLWWEQAGYVYIGRGLSPEAEAKMILVGLSTQSGGSTRSILAPQSPKWKSVTVFDTKVYDESGLGSGLVNVLAVDLDMGHEYGERITVARIHRRAWQDAGPLMRMVRLA
ncbi:heterokaryon incompatibility protein-domain-containing protein [Cladorrhinum sp. PSN259]|nr:heterokaryon incompatibility protein-domain-containing protein [Cladorrhinum sp. PSN259]